MFRNCFLQYAASAFLIVALSTFVPPAACADQSITVSAAASLTNALTELAATFEQQSPGKVYSNFAASTALLQQIEKGAPVDIFLSADQETMDAAQEKKLIVPDSRRNFVRNTLVLIVPQESKTASLEELETLQRIAIGNPDFVPAGRYTRDALRSRKNATGQTLWDSVQSRLVMANNVRQVLDYVARGEADAGFVYGSDAHAFEKSVRIIQTMDGHAPVLYPAAVVKGSKNPERAREFVDFLSGTEAQTILERHGFQAKD